MYLCESCGSPNVVSNKLEVAPFPNLANGTERLRATGHDAAAIGVAALWGLTHVVNAFSHAHRCADCGHLFS